MERAFLTILWLQFFSFADCQLRSSNVDSLELLLDNTNQDPTKMRLYAGLSFTYAFIQGDSSIEDAQKFISLARQIQYKYGEAAGLAGVRERRVY